MIKYEKFKCVICGMYFNRVIKSSLHSTRKLPNNVRGSNTITCSKDCSKIHTEKIIREQCKQIYINNKLNKITI